MNTQEYHRKRNAIYQKMVDASLIEDTDDNFETFDTILGEALDVDWDDRGIIIVEMGDDLTNRVLAKRIAKSQSTGQTPKIILVDDSLPSQSIADVFNEAMIIKNYSLNDDYILRTPKFDGSSGSRFNKPNTKNWKK